MTPIFLPQTEHNLYPEAKIKTEAKLLCALKMNQMLEVNKLPIRIL